MTRAAAPSARPLSSTSADLTPSRLSSSTTGYPWMVSTNWNHNCTCTVMCETLNMKECLHGQVNCQLPTNTFPMSRHRFSAVQVV